MKRVWIILLLMCTFPAVVMEAEEAAPVEGATGGTAEDSAPPGESVDIDDLIGVDWYGLYINGQKAGYARNEVSVGDDGVVTVTEDAKFALTMAAIRQDMAFNTVRQYTASGDLLRIESSVNDPTGNSRFVAVVSGESLKLTSEVAGQSKETTLPKPSESLNDALKHARWIANGPVEGDSLNFTMFDAMYAQEMTGMSHIVGTETRVFDGVATKVYKIKTTIDSAVMQLDSVSYVAEDGTTLEDEVAGMLKMRLENEEDAKDVDYSNDVIVSNAAMVEAPIANPRTRETLTLRLSGPLTEDHLFNDERQFFRAVDDHWVFESTQLRVADFEPVSIPVEDPEVTRYLETTTFVQSDHPAIVAQAKAIVGDESNTLKISNKICAWVSENMTSTFSARLTNALEVLNSMEGDCTEHSILFIGLCRAAGVPAREVAGLIYVEGTQPGFYFHQWAKVWIGKWIDVDPTFNQPRADVTHIKLAEGDIFRQTKIIPIIGKLSVEVISDAPVPEETS